MCKHTLASDEPHACPYQEDINGNYDEEFCNCCESCRYECCMDI